MVIIKESKRDDLLLPYLEIVKSSGKDMSLGQFKTLMLKILTVYGGMHYLSLSSNYYLAGVTKYYFNGDLTFNKDLSVLKDNPDEAQDQWKEDICTRLNALIAVLRNAYIDTVGEKFEIEEDFGTLSIAKLLRKYNKKINAELGIAEKQKEKEKETVVYDPNVGNGYTYKILYKFEDGTEFERPTSPGAWCITYLPSMYDRYIRLYGVHYVIFLRDGYEGVKRQTGPGFSKQKPHDEYGNSMIAYLQRNDSWEPKIITSRWNHGYGDTSGTEADHAYTLEEFCNITGVTPEDLKRIYEEWNSNRVKKKRPVDTETKEEKLQVLRGMKYAQMKLNNGEQPDNLFVNVRTVMATPGPDGSINFKKGIFTAQLKETEGNPDILKKYAFVIDRGKILFDTLYDKQQNGFFSVKPMDKWCNPYGENDKTQYPVKDTIVIPSNNGYFLYDARRKNYVTVDGVKKFKYIPYDFSWRNEKRNGTPLFYTVALRGKQKAFISCSNNQPLRLPNGEFWFASFESAQHSDSSNYRRDVRLGYAGFPNESIIEMVVDESSREKYFYNVKLRKFIQPPDLSDLSGDWTENAEIKFVNTRIKDFYGMFYTKGSYWGRRSPIALFDSNSQRVSFGGLSEFQNVWAARTYDNEIDPDIFLLGLTEKDKKILEERGYKVGNDNQTTAVMFDSPINSICVVEGNKIPEGGTNSLAVYDNFICYRVVDPDSNYGYYVYDINRHGFYINPINCPSKYLFDFVDIWEAQEDWTKVKVFTTPSRQRNWADRTNTVINFHELELDNSTLLRAQKEQQQAMPALSEDRIRSMVAETIKKLMETHYE